MIDMPENIIEVLQIVQNERFALEASSPASGNAIFNDEVTVKAIERELEAKRKEWRDLQGRVKSVAERAQELKGMRSRSAAEEKQLESSRSFIQSTQSRMKEVEKEANDLKAMSEEAKIQWTLQKRLQATIKQYDNISLTVDRTGREVATSMRYSNFISDNRLKRMSQTELEWLIAEAAAVKPMIQKLERDISESEQLYKTIKPQYDQVKKAEIQRNGGTLPRFVYPALTALAIQVRDTER